MTTSVTFTAPTTITAITCYSYLSCTLSTPAYTIDQTCDDIALMALWFDVLTDTTAATSQISVSIFQKIYPMTFDYTFTASYLQEGTHTLNI